MKKIIALLLVLVMVTGLFAACGVGEDTTGTTAPTQGREPTKPSESTNSTNPTDPTNPTEPTEPTNPIAPTEPVPPEDPWASYDIISLEEAIAICQQTGEAQTAEKYYVVGVVTEVWNDIYGNMNITDGVNTIKIYGSYSADGSTRYDAMESKPDVGDTVLLYGPLVNYKGNTPEMVDAWIIDFTEGEEPEIEMPPFDSTLTIAELLALPLQSGDITEGRYYVTATIDSITNAEYGAMYIADETGTISVYNSANKDGSIGYKLMEEKPYKGDLVTMYVTVQNFNGTFEIKSAWIISWESKQQDLNEADYTEMSIADARAAATGTKVKVSGVVARITYANGFIPSGVILVDGTNSIYVYDRDLAARVSIGNQITLLASKTYWILESEVHSANKYGYQGCNQLEEAYLLSNDEGNHDFDKSWIPTSTVKEVMDTPITTDISTTIFKVTALIKKVPGDGFVNYYINDLDGVTGSYCYSQCNGGDFDWLDAFDGKICTVYLMALNAKSNTSGCFWRFLPIAVYDEGFDVSSINVAEHVVKYYGVPQFLPLYTGDPELELITSVSSELLNFTNAELTYSSNNTRVVSFEGNVMHCGATGKATVTISCTYNGVTYSEDVQISVEHNESVSYITVVEAIQAAIDETVTVKGIVGPSLVNKVGFYLIDETGVIAVETDSDTLATLEIGHEVILEATRGFNNKNGSTYGQTCLKNATVVSNYYGNHAYSTDSFKGDISVADFYNLDINQDFTTSVYTMTATVVLEEGGYSSNIYLSDGTTKVRLYCSSAKQYKWLQAYVGQEITVEIAACNWNSKNYYTGCVLAVVLEDGTKVFNTLYFD